MATTEGYSCSEEKMTDLLVRLALVSELRPRSSLLSGSRSSSTPSPSSPSSPPASSSPSDASGETEDCSRPKKKKSRLLRFCSKLFKRKTQSEGERESRTKKFPKGTGYSVRKDDGWNVKAFVTDQRVKERQVVELLQEIRGELRKQYNNNPVCSDQIYSMLEESALVPFLESKLERISFLDICNDGPDLTPLN